MLILNIFILVLITQVDSFQFSMAAPKNSDTYGPYVVHWKYFGVCPKSESNPLANLTTSLEYDEDVYRATVNLSVSEAVRITEMRVIIQNVKNNRKKLLWDYTIEKPCQNRILAGSLKPYVDLRSCVLKKGFYYNKINFSEAVQIFFGPAFFYGEYIVKFTLASRKQDVACVLCDEIVTKKPKTDGDV